MRITIIGHCASGKSTLARNIETKLGIPHLHIDRLWFEGGGHALEKDDEKGKEKVRAHIKENVERFIEQEMWVSDGWFSRVQPLIADRADTIIFLDIPLRARLFNHIKRVLFSKRHPELNFWQDLVFVFDIIRRTREKDAPMREFIQQHLHKTTILRSHKDTDQFLNNIKKYPEVIQGN